MVLRTLDLFSGIGGFSLGLERTGGFETVAFCEINPFCRKVLQKHWTNVPIFNDIKAIVQKEINNLGQIDVICGGFPCQPVSCAGKRQGEEDARWLWPEFYRIICMVKPAWILVENVPGLLSAKDEKGRRGGLFAGILRDLASSGYDAEWNIVSAASVGAPHLRKRVFIVAHPNQVGRHGRAGMFWQGRGREPENGCNASDSDSTRLQIGKGKEGEWSHPTITRSDGRPIISRLGRTPDGLSEGLDGDRLISNEIHKCGYATKKETHPGKVLPILQSEIRTKDSRRTPFGADVNIQKEKILLLPMLRGLDSIEGNRSNKSSVEEACPESKESDEMRDMREGFCQVEQTSRRSPEGHGCQDTLLQMPHERGSEIGECSEKEDGNLCDMQSGISALGFSPSQNMFGSLFIGIGAQKRHEEVAPLNFWADGWENDTPRIANEKKNRVDRLRALGNAIVPQCAELVGKYILESIP